MTPGSNTSNHRPLHPRDDREALSALFDGQLPDDAARFAFKRLDHDAGWRDTCGRWQLIGDALRGEATTAAPAGFAAGVMQKLTAEGQVAAASPVAPGVDAAPAMVATRRRWFGGAALAASVVVAAVLVARPFSQPSATPAQTQVVAGAVAPAVAPERVAQRVAQSGERAAPATTSMAPSPSATTLAATAAPSAARHRSSRPAGTALRSVRPSVDDTATVVAAVEPATAQKPFHPPIDEIATRPWPRAVLPETGGGSLTVGFGATSTPTASLYPFEPRLPDAAATKPAATEPQR